MDALQLIAKRLAAPKRFRVVVTYSNGSTYTHDAETMAQAENHAGLFNSRIGRDVIRRDGTTASVSSVSVVNLA